MKGVLFLQCVESLDRFGGETKRKGNFSLATNLFMEDKMCVICPTGISSLKSIGRRRICAYKPRGSRQYKHLGHQIESG